MAKKKWTSEHISWSTAPWQLDIFAHLHQVYGFNFKHFPSPTEITASIKTGSSRFEQLGYEFIEQNDETLTGASGYEDFIYRVKQIPTRNSSWHDFFNACIWGLFPNSKQALNHQHIEQIQRHGSSQRSRKRDILTQFDECGIVLAYQNEQDKIDLRNHQWIDVFWHRRNHWQQQIKPFIFGHAIYEMSLEAFIGLTAKALFIKVDDRFFNKTLKDQYSELDNQVTDLMQKADIFADKTNLSPLPVLGIPGWSCDNLSLSYYKNTDYFRPRRDKR
ncbi:DUF3025 domain-containing protein [Gayadomonas joobiniege]|uniref:DUF3025 domain-containing protein n=1 Tax=Gayadomonas joobiniege TaxID=1234606 RepID=UPI000376AA5F|nr:DUF3025 domain-containing protein [Gayadomonas joobiniege]